MSVGYALLVSCGLCAVAAALEGLCAGRNVKSFFSTLRFPSYSAPLWLWSIIGGLYYVIFWFITYRLLKLENSLIRSAALALVLFMMLVNALTNYVIFRTQNLQLSFAIGCVFPFLDIALLFCLTQLDALSAWALLPYLIYRIYAVWWGYRLWTLNH